MTGARTMSEWKTSACILCECNCGIQVQLGGENDREIVRIRGDKAHPGSFAEYAKGLTGHLGDAALATSSAQAFQHGLPPEFAAL